MSSIISLDAAYQLYSNSPETVKFVDASYSMPGAGDMRMQIFSQYRLPSATYFDIDTIADLDSPLPHMLPSEQVFSQSVAVLGISNEDTVIVYAQEHAAMAACRVWWMFKTFGHENILVLDGSLRDWMNAGLPLSTQEVKAITTAVYKAVLNSSLVVSLNDLASDDGMFVVDARGAERFNGSAAEPRKGLQSGHIPGSVNLPFSVFFNSNGRFIDSAKREATKITK